MGLKAPSFFPEAPIQKPTKNHLVGTKHAPITQEMPEDVGDLCKTLLLPQHWENYKDFRNSCFRNRIKDQIQQELGAKTKYISYYVTGEPSGQKIGCSCAQLTGSALSAGASHWPACPVAQSLLGPWAIFLLQSKTCVAGGAEKCCLSTMLPPANTAV